MLQRPIYQTALALLTLAALAGAVYAVARPGAPPGIQVSLPPTPTPAPPTTAQADAGLVNINTASAIELDAALPGIGPVLAGRIVAYREANGPFAAVDGLMDVEGIGPVTYDRIRDLVTVGD